MVDSVIGIVLENINSLLKKEFGLIWGVDQEIRRLSSTLGTIQDVLGDAEVKQSKEEAIRGWLKKLKDAAYDADDILDEFAAKALQFEEAQVKRSCSNLTCNQVTHSSFLSWFNFEQLMFRRKIGHRIKDIRERFDDIAAERSNFHLERSPIEINNSYRETSSILTESQVYGRDEDKEEIVKLLLDNDNSNTNFLVYPIVGMGGLGKTTLAQLVYNDERVKDHFKPRIWVCVSDDFDVKRLTSAIVESMGGTTRDLTNLDPLQTRLRQMLGGKRFLLVLDDVWEEDENKWDTLKSSLTNGNEGSSILVTTRIEKVASIMSKLPAHHLKGLSEEDCWALFQQRAFDVGRNRENANLVEIGKEIVKKCGGVPLAAKALGSLMRFKHTEAEWLRVRESEIWDLTEKEGNTILPALRLSYNHLPLYSRQCFAYCSIFPKDCIMQKERLVHLWMANGFIPREGKKELEEKGDEIFNDLLCRCFFQVVEKNVRFDKVVVECKLHDLLHDLACSVMVNECLSLKSDGMEKIVLNGIRHLSMQLRYKAPIGGSLSSLRTLLLELGDTPLPEFKLSNFKCLRALHLSCPLSSTNILSSVACLIHLRYLNLSSMFDIRVLPESLTDLKHLQTLILRDCWSLEKLPLHMSTMSSLRHLDIGGCRSLSHMPKGIGRLIHLQALYMFIVGKKSSGCARISELEGLNNLRGHLQIKCLENVKNSMDAKEVNLVRKRNLDSLNLCWSKSPSVNETDHVQLENSEEEVLQGLQPPAGSIKILKIKNYEGMKFPSWMEMGDDLTLQNLVRIKLVNCNRCERLPPLGNLPLLKFLFVRGMNSVRYLSDGLGNVFPSLEELWLWDMVNLEELLLLMNNNTNIVPADDDDHHHHEEGIRGRQVAFPCLVNMWIENCDKLTTLTPLVLPSLEYLFLKTGNENVPEGFLQIRNLPVLHTLQIRRCTKLVTLPRLLSTTTYNLLGELDFKSSCSLKVLEIHDCDALKSLWREDETQLQFQGLSSLKELRIQCCHSLASLSGMRYLTALEKLGIARCPELQLSQVEDFRYLTSLQHLEISFLPKLICLPESLKHATMLQSLGIFYCGGLTALPKWIHNLTSLRKIEISECENLTFLPDGLSQLTALQTLEIRSCHVDLKTRCKEGGEDWHKISHIPNVIITPRQPRATQPPSPVRQNHGCWSDLLESRWRRSRYI